MGEEKNPPPRIPLGTLEWERVFLNLYIWQVSVVGSSKMAR